ncbi:PAS domain-containing protein [Synechocystis sp. PCC 7509]|uniref:PAS domain-containing protein n=1 Tax=Synechocystis sp. PCC 7509 TaxID=927677 RepID=UPI0002ACFDFD|nr:PAS domain-containing protein [Synechocystis sp. PCC 7509]
MNLDNFTKQVESINIRLEDLYEGVKTNLEIPLEIMPTAFKELGVISEELQVSLEELQQQNEELRLAQIALEVQKQRYQELFEFAPNAYLVTDEQGIIQEVNCVAANLFNVQQRFLIGKPLIVFIAEENRQLFHVQLTQLQQGKNTDKWNLCLLPRNLQPFKAELLVSKISDWEGNLIGLRICVSDTEAKLKAQLEKSIPAQDNSKSIFNSQKHTYLRGELIPIKHQTIWQVCQGVVKLSTVCENGEEILVGLVGFNMLFGAELTCLQTYQATALSKEVQLINVPWAEIANSPHLAQNVITQVSLRLRQTEALLAISGQRRVKDRFYQLLQLLKQEIGESVELGTRLNIRFTHQDFADACSTTRVTITRLIGKLQAQGKIKVDSKNHLILIEGNR